MGNALAVCMIKRLSDKLKMAHFASPSLGRGWYFYQLPDST